MTAFPYSCLSLAREDDSQRKEIPGSHSLYSMLFNLHWIEMGEYKLGPLHGCLKSTWLPLLPEHLSPGMGRASSIRLHLTSDMGNGAVCTLWCSLKGKNCYSGGRINTEKYCARWVEDLLCKWVKYIAFSKVKRATLIGNTQQSHSQWLHWSTCKSSKGWFQHCMPRFPLQFIWESCAWNTG